MSYNYGPLVLGQSESSREDTTSGMTTSLVAPDPEDLARPASAVVRCAFALRLRYVTVNIMMWCSTSAGESSIRDFPLFSSRLSCTVLHFPSHGFDPPPVSFFFFLFCTATFFFVVAHD